MTWPAVRLVLQSEYGLFDLDGRPIDAALVASIRRAHTRGLRERRDDLVAAAKYFPALQRKDLTP